ncbi:MAG: FIST signal transduction protein [bacterium]|jgi:hypothetical protein|nr:FIST C-terminal domain-containing protein [Betaproteobacteria bacterium]
MKIEQFTAYRTPAPGDLASLAAITPDLVLAFGSVSRMAEPGLLEALRDAFPATVLAGCPTAGEIGDLGVTDQMLGLTAVRFDQPGVTLATTDLASMADSFDAGVRLALDLPVEGLHNVLVFGLGVDINGSALIAGLASCLPAGVAIAGRLAGDGGASTRTLTLSSRAVSDRQLVAVGLHGPRTHVTYGSFHGWKPFGPARRVTRAEGNVLFELDGAQAAAEQAHGGSEASGDSLALLVSCVGRRLVMGARVDEEVEAVAAVFGCNTRVAGFYSSGEISPLLASTECWLHNQTMTITLLRESA